jgi:hypothetical protein
MTDDTFKTCGSCGALWKSLEAFLAAPDVTFLGYQAFVRDGVLGLFLFNHVCATTLAIRADRFRQLHDEVVHGVPEHISPMCLTKESGEPCPDACECGWANRVIDTIESWPKEGGGRLGE